MAMARSAVILYKSKIGKIENCNQEKKRQHRKKRSNRESMERFKLDNPKGGYKPMEDSIAGSFK
jgi:hypothetical protein